MTNKWPTVGGWMADRFFYSIRIILPKIGQLELICRDQMEQAHFLILQLHLSISHSHLCSSVSLYGIYIVLLSWSSKREPACRLVFFLGGGSCSSESIMLLITCICKPDLRKFLSGFFPLIWTWMSFCAKWLPGTIFGYCSWYTCRYSNHCYCQVFILNTFSLMSSGLC